MIFFDEIYVSLMILSSVVFWLVIPEGYRTKFIILGSFTALGFIQFKFALFLLLLIWLVFWGGKIIERSSGATWLVMSILVLVTVLLAFKYGDVLFAILFSSDNKFSQTYMIPLGISYLSFKLIAYIIDVFRGNIKNPRLEELLAFILFLPIFPAGPIERYQDFADHRQSEFDWSFYIMGLKRLSLGYFKKVVVVNFALNEIVVKRLYPSVVSDGVSFDVSAVLVLVFLIGALFYAFFDLSGYADIAIGFGHLFGYKICENMNYPILQKNLSDYWNCWHISLSHWCRNNVYFPVLGQTRNNVLALYCSFIVMGLWHYVSLNWVLWGIWHATGITVYSKWKRYKRQHKRLRKLLPSKVAFAVGVALTVVYSGLGFSFIMMDTTPKALRVLLAIVI